ncbi:MAG: DNA mismatch repair endonuclease MutL [Pseudomonadota bacterium]
MGNKISQLSVDVINKIAAGEVVERPASVIKELIENSIDAEANDIHIELVDAGKKQIVVKDNGTGINNEDIELALAHHATSKISSLEDLYTTNSLGFRGEALGAIASVSRTTITSKSKKDASGIKLHVEYGEIKNKEKKAVSNGTTVDVEELYSNTPARLKFLRKSNTELSHCITTINNYAIAYPSVSFKLLHNGRSLFFYPQTEDSMQRLSSVLGTKAEWLTAKSAYEYASGEIFILDPSDTESVRDIKIFVNGRFIRDRIVNHAVKSYFEKHLSTGETPLTILFLNIDPAFVDSNVSPTKNEVRFRETNFIHSFVQNTIEQAMRTSSTLASTSASTSTRPATLRTEFTQTFETISDKVPHKTTGGLLNLNVGGRKIIGQFKRQYIVMEDENKLILIDQHAAHERINFEKITESLKNSKDLQQLLIPELLELNIETSTKFRDFIPELNKHGFNIEEFDDKNKGKNSFLIRNIPRILLDVDVKELFRELIKDNADDILRPALTKKIALIGARLSCHASIRGKEELSLMEINQLLDNLQKCEFPYTCPHGRPVKIELTLSDIEKMFKRK